MDPCDPAATREFVEELLRTGLVLTDMCAGILEALPPGAFGDEDPAEVLLEMVTGSVLPVAAAAGPQTLTAATALLGATADRIAGDLRTAAERAAAGRR